MMARIIGWAKAAETLSERHNAHSAVPTRSDAASSLVRVGTVAGPPRDNMQASAAFAHSTRQKFK